MDEILFVVLFITTAAWLFSVYFNIDDETHKDKNDNKVQGCEEENKIETLTNEEETPTNTGGY